MDIDMQHRPGHAAWTWSCSIDLDMQHGLGHGAWTSNCSMDMDKNMDISVADPNLFAGSRIFIPDPAPALAVHNCLYMKKVSPFMNLSKIVYFS